MTIHVVKTGRKMTKKAARRRLFDSQGLQFWSQGRRRDRVFGPSPSSTMLRPRSGPGKRVLVPMPGLGGSIGF